MLDHIIVVRRIIMSLWQHENIEVESSPYLRAFTQPLTPPRHEIKIVGRVNTAGYSGRYLSDVSITQAC